jgi:hypothetical protein
MVGATQFFDRRGEETFPGNGTASCSARAQTTDDNLETMVAVMQDAKSYAFFVLRFRSLSLSRQGSKDDKRSPGTTTNRAPFSARHLPRPSRARTGLHFPR